MLHVAGTGQSHRDPPRRKLLRTILGEVLRRTRRAQHRTLAEVSREARVSMQYLSELERGRKEASSEVLAAVCEALGMDLAYLLTETGRQLAGDRARPGTVIRLRNLAGSQQPETLHVPGAAQQDDARALGPGEILSLLAA